MTILAVIPIVQEFDAMMEAMAEFGYAAKERSVGRLAAAEFDGGRLIVAQGGLGKTQFGVQTQHLLDNLSGIDAVVCAGTSGALSDTLDRGDVVIAAQTVEHDFNRGSALITLPLPTFPGDAALIDALRALASRKAFPFTLHFGGVASGDEGVANRARAQEISDATGAIAVAWEGAGGARAAQLAEIPFLEIRGISDGAGESALEEFWQNIPSTIRNVALIVRELAGLLD